jgi:hypothetical protein
MTGRVQPRRSQHSGLCIAAFPPGAHGLFADSFKQLLIARNSSRSDDFNQFGNLGRSEVGQRKLGRFFREQDMGHAGTCV